jgi:hypothetical protein
VVKNESLCEAVSCSMWGTCVESTGACDCLVTDQGSYRGLLCQFAPESFLGHEIVSITGNMRVKTQYLIGGNYDDIALDECACRCQELNGCGGFVFSSIYPTCVLVREGSQGN